MAGKRAKHHHKKKQRETPEVGDDPCLSRYLGTQASRYLVTKRVQVRVAGAGAGVGSGARVRTVAPSFAQHSAAASIDP